MDELYEDLENYDDVDTANKLKTENAELKHKLAECNKSMQMLQKEFDKLAAEFKILETNYSSLLKIARTEIQRKTEMISNLNIEKDMLIITAAQKAPPNKVMKLVKNVQTEAKRKKKKRNTAKGCPKDRTEFIRRECARPPSSEASSTATDKSKIVDNEKIIDDKASVRVTRENETHKREVFLDHRGDGNRSPVAVDRRLALLARHQFSKLSSDEEFEDLYSALKPETPLRELERNRKRSRDVEDSKTFYNKTHDRPCNYPDPFRERHNRNRTGRFSNNDRNINRDKQYNEGDRNVNRDKQYDGNELDKYDSYHQRYSPERYRRGAKEYVDDRYTQQYDRNRRLVSPPRERNQHRSRERRRSCHDREREDHKETHRLNYPDTHSVRHHIHGEYDEPQNKRPRIDPPIHQEERRLSEKQYSKDMYPSNLRDHTCQSPDFSHEESSSEPIPEIRSTASSVLEDPRGTSNKYVKSTEGNKEVLLSANAHKIFLQPVNKSLWNVEDVQLPKALKFRPTEISEELVDDMDVDKPLSIISMESGEVCSDTTDTVINDVSDFRSEVNKSKYEYSSCKTNNQKIEEKPRKENSLIESTGKDNVHKSDKLEKHDKNKSPTENTLKEIGQKSSNVLEEEPKTKSKFVKSEKTNYRRTDEPTTPPRDCKKVTKNTENDTTEKPSILHRLIHSILDKSPERDDSGKSSKSKEGKERKERPVLKRPENPELVTSKIVERKEHVENSESKKFDKTEKDTLTTAEIKVCKKSFKPEKEYEGNAQIYRDFEHRVYSTRHIVEGDLELSDESNHETQLKIDEKTVGKIKQKTRRKSTRDISKEKSINLESKIKNTRSKKENDEKTTNKLSELFGDSSSLITPEDLNLATKAAHGLPAECCPPAPEDAQDGIVESQESVQTVTSKVLNRFSDNKGKCDGSTIEEDKHKAKVTKDSKNRIQKRHKNSETALLSDVTQAPDKLELNEVKSKTVNSSETPSDTEVKLVLPNEKLMQMQNAKTTTESSQSDAFKVKGSVKSNKKLKNKDEKRKSISEPVQESNKMVTYNPLETNSSKTLASDDKENASGNDNLEGNISSEMAKIFENTLVSDVSKEINEKLPLHNSEKDTVNSTVVQDVPNLAPVLDEPGLVKTVVISTGIQLLDSNFTQHSTAFNALASSTPAKEVSIINNSTEMEQKISHSAHVSVTIERDDTVPQSENDAPDIRINYYRRRRKVLKR